MASPSTCKKLLTNSRETKRGTSQSKNRHLLGGRGTMNPAVKRLSRSLNAASAPLPFAGLKPNPQPYRGGLVNPSNTDSPPDVI